MRLILTALLFLFGLFNLMLGIGFLVDPTGLGATFKLIPDGPGGLAVLRADLTAFFLVAGVASCGAAGGATATCCWFPRCCSASPLPAARSAPCWMARRKALPCRWRWKRCR